MEPGAPPPVLRDPATGPFRADQVRPGDRYELSDGHPVYCNPVGGDGSRANVLGAAVLATDLAAADVGIDTGYRIDEKTLRAPDIAVGNVPDAPGWVSGTSALAVEYASRGQDEDDLQRRIADLLAAGTRQVWVVRMLGERHVEVHRPGQPMQIARAGETLTAPGVLRDPVRVEALFDRDAAFAETFRHLLQRNGYASLDEVRREGRDAGASAVVLRAVELRLGRRLTDAERQSVERRLRTLGHDAVVAYALDHTAEQVATWCADPDDGGALT